MPKKKALKKATSKSSTAKQPKAQKQVKKQLPLKKAAKKKSVKPTKVSRSRFPNASALRDLREEHMARLGTLATMAGGIDDPPGACVTVDSTGRWSCVVTRQSLCGGANSKFYPNKACPA